MAYSRYLMTIFALLLVLILATEAFGYERTESGSLVFNYQNQPETVQLFKTAGYAEGLVRQYQYQCGLQVLPGPTNPVVFIMNLQVLMYADAQKEGLEPESYAAFYIIDNFNTGMSDAVDLECHDDVTEYLRSYYNKVAGDVTHFIQTQKEESL